MAPPRRPRPARGGGGGEAGPGPRRRLLPHGSLTVGVRRLWRFLGVNPGILVLTRGFFFGAFAVTVEKVVPGWLRCETGLPRVSSGPPAASLRSPRGPGQAFKTQAPAAMLCFSHRTSCGVCHVLPPFTLRALGSAIPVIMEVGYKAL